MKLSADLRVSMDMALAEARQRRHEFSTVEHLLYAFLHDDPTRKVIKNAGANLDQLRAGLEAHLEDNVPRIPETAVLRVHPSIGFSRVVQRAALHVQGAGKEEVEPVNVLVAMYSEPDGHASYLLEEAGARRLDVVRFLSHGVAKRGEPGAERGDALSGGSEFEADEAATETNPLDAYASNLNERAEKGGIDPLIGRHREVDRLIHIVARRRKNNPMLVGDA
ncbi:MAG: ATP-dependent Clp protease ATP-binding subunit ClpA, partial [Myxococcota bacterium]